MYYIYAHITKGTNEIFYIGKGSGNRLNHVGNRSKEWKDFAYISGYYAVKLIDGIENEVEAYEKEKEYITLYKDKNLCQANISLGGLGVTVGKRWWGSKISKSLKGRFIPKGALNKNYKPFTTKETLESMYKSGKKSPEIAEILGVSSQTVCARLEQFGIEKKNAGKEKIRVICVTDGKEFSSINEAARYYGVFRENIAKVLRGKYKHTGNLIFKYLK